jgi:hypothetical protein
MAAYLNGLAASSRRPQLSALDWIARRSTQVYTAETLPWHRLASRTCSRSGACSRSTTSRPPPTACWPRCAACCESAGTPQLLTTDDYQAATSIPALRGESEARGRDLSTGEVRGLIVIADGMANRRRIEEVRGAAQLSIGPDGPVSLPRDSSETLALLLSRGLLRADRDVHGTGRPLVYRPTPRLLQLLGVETLEEARGRMRAPAS